MVAYKRSILFFIFLWLIGHKSSASTESFSGNINEWFKATTSAQDQGLPISTITFSSNVKLGKHEFFYLTDLKENSTITRDEIARAYRRLMAKKRFSQISFDIKEEDRATNLHVTLTAQWLFKKVFFDDIWVRASTFQQLYLQQPGNPFEAQGHEDSLVAIKKQLHDQGFFNSSPEDHLHFNEKDKTVTVHISLNKKERFTIKNVSTQLHFKNNSRAETKFLNPILKKAREALEDAPYSKKQVMRIVQQYKKILRKNRYSHIRITHTAKTDAATSSANIIFNVSAEAPRQIICTGNKAISTYDILNDIVAKQIPDWLFSPDVLKQHLLHEYYRKGYWHAHISYTKNDDDCYVFTITEGQQLNVSSVIMNGNQHPLLKQAKALIDQLAQTRGDQEKIGFLLDELKALYLANGYWDFSIQKRDFVKNEDGETYTIMLHLTEGKQRLWAGFKIKNNKDLEQADFFKQFKRPMRHELVPCNLAWIGQQRQFIGQHYQQKGYWYADVKPEIICLPITDQEHPNADKIFLLWQVEPGALVRFGKTIIQGLSSIPFHRIKKHIAFQDGMTWDRKLLDATRSRLKQLDVFKITHVQPTQLSHKKSRKNIVVTLVDDDPIELRARVGYYFNSGNALFPNRNMAKIGASFILKNPTNRADKITVDGDWNPYERKFNFAYQQPMPLNFDGIGKTQIYLNKLVHPAEISGSYSAYQALVYGVRGSLENEYKKHYFWSLSFGNEWTQITKVQGNLKFDPTLINKTLPYFFVEPRLTINRLNDPINTTSGGLTQASIRFIIPEHNNDLEAKLILEQSFFFSLTNKLVLALRGCFGHLFRGKFDKILPNERFYLGGQSSVRGYGQDSIPPFGVSLGVDKNNNPVTHYTIQGGSTMLQGNIELRYAIDKSIGINLFHDIGILSQNGLPGLQQTWYPGSGFGLRYKTPIGAIRLDVGWRWKKRLPQDSKKPEIYITLNEAF